MSAPWPDRRPLDREERAALVALASLPWVGPATLLGCIDDPGPTTVWDLLLRGRGHLVAALGVPSKVPIEAQITQMQRAAETLDPEAVLLRHERDGQQILVLGDASFPDRLRFDHSPPTVVFARGDLAVLDQPTVAIVGTRNATRLGCDTAAALASDLCRRGIAIVSGLALGIDGAAHTAVIEALAAERGEVDLGLPIGVVATGLDRAYPRRHHLLHRQVATQGILVTESPIGTSATRWRFPARNRIIAGLADAVVVVESRSRGGSMSTAAEALARDVPILAVPGHPSSPASAGALDLLYDGASPVRDVDDVLVAIGRGGRRAQTDARPTPTAAPDLTEDERAVLDALVGQPRSLAEVLLATGLDLEVLSAALAGLEARGLLVRTGSWFERVAPGGAGVAGGARR